MRPMPGTPANCDVYTYGVAITFTALLQTATASISIQQDADFVWLMSCYSHTDTTSPQVNGGSLIQITDQGSNRLLTNVPVPIADYFGTAQRPFYLPVPHTFQRSGVINISLQNQGIAAQVVRLTFHGYKLFA